MAAMAAMAALSAIEGRQAPQAGGQNAGGHMAAAGTAARYAQGLKGLIMLSALLMGTAAFNLPAGDGGAVG
eukprot:SAG22_NODE_4219_length_1338_cov_6.703793_1_plen_70_part_10